MRRWIFLVMGLVLSGCFAEAHEATITFSVPGSSIVTTGDFAGPPDGGGGFDIAVPLSRTPISAEGCEGQPPLLAIIFDSTALTGDATAYTDAQTAIIARKMKYYNELVAAEKSSAPVLLHVEIDQKNLYKKAGHLFAPSCIIGFDTEALPND